MLSCYVTLFSFYVKTHLLEIPNYENSFVWKHASSKVLRYSKKLIQKEKFRTVKKVKSVKNVITK